MTLERCSMEIIMEVKYFIFRKVQESHSNYSNYQYYIFVRVHQNKYLVYTDIIFRLIEIIKL